MEFFSPSLTQSPPGGHKSIGDSWCILYPFFRFSSFSLVALTEGVLLGLYQTDGCLGTQEVSGAAFTIKWLMVKSLPIEKGNKIAFRARPHAALYRGPGFWGGGLSLKSDPCIKMTFFSFLLKGTIRHLFTVSCFIEKAIEVHRLRSWPEVTWHGRDCASYSDISKLVLCPQKHAVC